MAFSAETHCNALPSAAQKLNVKYFSCIAWPKVITLPCCSHTGETKKILFTNVRTNN